MSPIGPNTDEAPAASPLTRGSAKKVGEIKRSTIVDAYRTERGVDVTPYLADREFIEIWRCEETGLEFYYPTGMSGPPKFYEELYSSGETHPDYHTKRWEFAVAAEYARGAEKVLDVGCDQGAFLSGVRGLAGAVAGLETSPLGVKICREKGIPVFPETIEKHAAKHEGVYDVVTTFQVIEHVDDPASFVKNLVAVLRPGGALIISAPNNESFLRHCALVTLNTPPHHVTLWNRRSLEALAFLYDLDILRVEKEPLQPMNLEWYQATMEAKYLPKSRLARSLYYRFGGARAFRRYLEDNLETIDGHTMMVVYRKR